MGNVDDVKSILVWGWGLIGDVFIRVPLIEALRQHFPAARIAVVVDPASVPVLEHHPACDEVIPLGRRSTSTIRQLLRVPVALMSLRRRHFDLSVDLYGGGSSPRFSRIVNAATRLSFDHTSALRSASNLVAECPAFDRHWSKALGTMLAPLGISEDEIRRGTSFYCSAAALQYAHEFVAGKPGPLVAFNLGAGADDKRWPVERFVALAREIRAHHGYMPLVFTNPGMEQLATEFARQYGEGAVVAPLLSLDRVGALMQKCAYVITGDTSLMHMAFGLKRPTLVLFTFTRPEMVMPEDCPVEACFVESNSGETYCGKLAGTVDIPVSEATAKFEALHSACQAQGG